MGEMARRGAGTGIRVPPCHKLFPMPALPLSLVTILPRLMLSSLAENGRARACARQNGKSLDADIRDVLRSLPSPGSSACYCQRVPFYDRPFQIPPPVCRDPPLESRAALRSRFHTRFQSGDQPKSPAQYRAKVYRSSVDGPALVRPFPSRKRRRFLIPSHSSRNFQFSPGPN